MRGSARSLALGGCAALACGARVAPADGPKAGETPPATSPAPPTVVCTSGQAWQHLLGLLLDAGQGQASYGIRYVNAYRAHSGCGGLGVLGWAGYGLEVRGDGTSAMETAAVGRAGMMGDASAFGIELAAGDATTFSRTIAVGSVAFLLDFLYVGLGASYRFPIGFDRPAWLGGLEFALRVHVPLFTYGVHEERTGPPPPDRAPPPAPNVAGASCQGSDLCVCPSDWKSVRPGSACAVAQGTECFGNDGTSGTYFRCCSGVWGKWWSDGGKATSGSGPCP